MATFHTLSRNYCIQSVPETTEVSKEQVSFFVMLCLLWAILTSALSSASKMQCDLVQIRGTRPLHIIPIYHLLLIQSSPTTFRPWIKKVLHITNF